MRRELDDLGDAGETEHNLPYPTEQHAGVHRIDDQVFVARNAGLCEQRDDKIDQHQRFTDARYGQDER